MSLVTFLKIPDVREKFVQQFPKPPFELKKGILAPPRTKRYMLIGTAFDYLLRFYIQRLNPKSIVRPWIAEEALGYLPQEIIGLADITEDGNPTPRLFLDPFTGELIEVTEESDIASPYAKVGQILDKAKTVYNGYLSSGDITDEVIETTLLLAQVDLISRTGKVDENMGNIDIEDVADLRQLISIVNPENFRARELCLLNPTFGNASVLVGGADADLVIDDTLIDIKTTKDLSFTRDYFLQLAGYYTLYKIGGIGDLTTAPKIERLGIYYSRHAELYTIPVNKIVDGKTFAPFMKWFKKRASAEYS